MFVYVDEVENTLHTFYKNSFLRCSGLPRQTKLVQMGLLFQTLITQMSFLAETLLL